MTPILEVKDLKVSFHTKDGVVRAVNGISYHLEEGEIVGFVGESGCGKSVSVLSLLRLIPEPPARIDDGEAWFNGIDLLRMAPSQMHEVRGRQIAFIFQDPMTSLNPVMTIGAQISEAIRVNLGITGDENRQRVIEALENVGIPRAAERLGDYPHQFSGGMRQRVVIAMAICCRPKLLIADEPTTSLDVTIQAQIVELVKRFQRELNMAVIWITHDLGVVARLAKRVNVMYAGSIIEMGPIRSIYKRTLHPYTIGLLSSVPRITMRKGENLQYIEGAPPDMVRLPKGCPFVPRCIFSTEKCLAENPSLTPIDEDHWAACWNIEAVQAAGGMQRTGTQESP